MASSADLVDDVLAEILLCLPPGCVLRSRAVCKRWRRITTCPRFVAAYSRRRPPELLVFPDGYRMGNGARNALGAVDPAGDTTSCRRLLRFHDPVRLVDSCDGLLLFSRLQRSFLVCNPATRQWASLPPLTPQPCISVLPSGFYFHRPSGEHRLLCIGDIPPPELFKYDAPSGKFLCLFLPPGSSEEVVASARDFYYILSTAHAAEPRRLGRVAGGGHKWFPSASVTIHGTLYWSYHPEAGGSGDMVAFDTVSETFRLIPPPPSLDLPRSYHHLRVFDMDGRLAMSAVEQHSRHMDVWAFEDGVVGDGGGSWACLVRIDLPPPRRRVGWYPTYEAAAFLDGGALLVVGSGWVVLYDVKEKRTVSKINCSRCVRNLSQCLYRESLVPLPEPDARPCPCHMPSGKPLLHYFTSEDDANANTSMYGNKCGDKWIVSNDC